MTTRREFVERAALTALGLSVPAAAAAALERSVRPSTGAGFLDLLRAPDLVQVQTAKGARSLRYSGGRWTGDDGIVVDTTVQSHALHVALSSPRLPIQRVYLRWRGSTTDTQLIMGDAWERAYGDLEWRGRAPDRVMPWYFATYTGALTHAYGVRTGARAFCYWQVDNGGISLCADVRSASAGVRLGERTLDVCDVICRAGDAGESSYAALHAFCMQMCVEPRLPRQPVYGSNDWYWAYGNNSATSVRTDAHHIVELSPTGANRPFVVIDDGWQPGRGAEKTGAGTWGRGNEKFPDMAALAADVRQIGARAGIWIRPLQPPADTPASWRLSREHGVLDPTVPDVLKKITDDITRIRSWGFELIKHDYTTFDIFGRWGFQMGSALTRDGWTFASGTGRTSAEVISDLYSSIRSAAGDSLVIGCNTVSHLSAGHFELCRIGDDTSGTEWSRTRKMGVNSLAFRGAQHNAFYAADADCAAITTAIPWTFGRQWLDVLSRSGAPLFVSLASDALGAPQRNDLRAALSRAAVHRPLGEPLDWQHTVYPERWRMADGERLYDWVGADGVGLP
jgi:alpha-galactosidase